MNEREKIINERANIINIIKRWHCAQSRDINGHTIWLTDDNERLADTLIANGYGDVSEWKRRAEVAESELEKHKRALRIAAPRLKCYGGWGKGFCAVSDCEYRNCGNDEGCVLAHLRKAEREIEEEERK